MSSPASCPAVAAALELESELEAAAREELERELDAALRANLGAPGDPVTDADLYRYLRHVLGGIRKDPDHWDRRLTRKERRAAYRYLERGWRIGEPADEVAQEIGHMWPWYGIRDSDDLFAWLERTRGPSRRHRRAGAS